MSAMLCGGSFEGMWNFFPINLEGYSIKECIVNYKIINSNCSINVIGNGHHYIVLCLLLYLLNNLTASQVKHQNSPCILILF